MKLDREKNLELARNCAAQVVRDYKPGFALAEDIMMQMAKVAMDALDCDMRRQPFHSATLSKLSYHARDFISTDKESTLAKVAYAFAIIMGELNGSIIGTARTTTSIKDVSATALPINICDKDVKLEPLDDEEMAVKEEVIEDMMEPTANYSQLFSHDGLEEVKKEDLEDPIMYSDDQPSSSFALPQAPIVDQPCSSKSKTVARSQYAQGEVHARIGTHRKRPRGDDQLAVRACNPRGIVDPTPPKPRANGGECKYCNVPVRLGEFDNHMRNCHGEIFLQDISRCPIKECDFRSMVPETRRQHAIFHTRNNSWDYYAIDINTTCPYCPETVTTIGDYTMHMSNCHRTMTINRVQIHGCGCGLKTARVHQMIEHWDVLRSCERRLFFNYGVARAALQHVNALKQQRPREMRLVAISQGCRRLQTTSSQLKDNHWRCRICLLPLRKPEVDAHMQLEHRDVWLKEEHKCFVKECDFRSTIPETLQHHQMTFVTHNGSSIGNIYSIGLGATCPYCPLMLTNIGDYVRHLDESHKSMMASLARVNVCACCGYASSRVFQMIIHWNARKTACKCTMRFDYAVAKAALEKSQKEDARIGAKEKTDSAPSRHFMPHLREANLKLARDYAYEIIVNHQPGFSPSEEIIVRLARISIAALDSSLQRKPFHSGSLKTLSDEFHDYIISDNELSLAKLAFAYTTVMSELNGKIIGPTHITSQVDQASALSIVTNIGNVDVVKQEPIDEKTEIKQEVPEDVVSPTEDVLFQNFPEECKQEEMEETFDVQGDEPGPCSSFLLANSDYEASGAHDQYGARTGEESMRRLRKRKLQDPMTTTIPQRRAQANAPKQDAASRSEWLQNELKVALDRQRNLPLPLAVMLQKPRRPKAKPGVTQRRSNGVEKHPIDNHSGTVDMMKVENLEEATAEEELQLKESSAEVRELQGSTGIHKDVPGPSQASLQLKSRRAACSSQTQPAPARSNWLRREMNAQLNPMRYDNSTTVNILGEDVVVHRRMKKESPTVTKLKTGGGCSRMRQSPVACPHCGQVVRTALDDHIEQFHREIWLQDSNKCLVRGCDFVSMDPNRHNIHTKTAHSKASAIYAMSLNTRCPFCPEHVATIGDYTAHVAEHHSMIYCRLPIHVCVSCGFKSSRIHQMISHWSEPSRLRMCRSEMCFDYTVARAYQPMLAKLNLPSQPMPSALEPITKGERCTYCKAPVKVVDLDAHFRQFHEEIWLEDVNKCNVSGCDFRSVIPATRREHVHNFTAHKHWSRDYYAVKLDVACPYCPEVVPSVGAYVRHKESSHREMIVSQAPIHICESCGFACSHAFEIISHWSELNSKCLCLMRFDYPAARNVQLELVMSNSALRS